MGKQNNLPCTYEKNLRKKVLDIKQIREHDSVSFLITKPYRQY